MSSSVRFNLNPTLRTHHQLFNHIPTVQTIPIDPPSPPPQSTPEQHRLPHKLHRHPIHQSTQQERPQKRHKRQMTIRLKPKPRNLRERDPVVHKMQSRTLRKRPSIRRPPMRHTPQRPPHIHRISRIPRVFAVKEGPPSRRYRDSGMKPLPNPIPNTRRRNLRPIHTNNNTRSRPNIGDTSWTSRPRLRHQQTPRPPSPIPNPQNRKL